MISASLALELRGSRDQAALDPRSATGSVPHPPGASGVVVGHVPARSQFAPHTPALHRTRCHLSLSRWLVRPAGWWVERTGASVLTPWRVDWLSLTHRAP